MSGFPEVAFHWSPADRRESIEADGLRPRQPSVKPVHNLDGSLWFAPYVCLGLRPSIAWSLSAGHFGEPGSEWLLWEARVLVSDRPRWALREPASCEVRVRGIPRRRLWLVGSRTLAASEYVTC